MYEHVYTLYEHVGTQYVHGTYQASPFTYRLSQQVFVANTEMEYGVISLFPLLQGRMRMRVVLAQKMVIFFMQGQMLLKQRRQSASLSMAWRAWVVCQLRRLMTRRKLL